MVSGRVRGVEGGGGCLIELAKGQRRDLRDMGDSSASFGILVQVHLVCKWEVSVVIKAHTGTV